MRSRLRLAIAAPIVVVLGLALRFGLPPMAGDLVGGVLYAVLVFVIVGFCLCRASSLVVGMLALVACVAVELLQATPVPALLAEVFPPAALVLGTSFAWADLPPYVVGAVVGILIDRFFLVIDPSISRETES